MLNCQSVFKLKYTTAPESQSSDPVSWGLRVRNRGTNNIWKRRTSVFPLLYSQIGVSWRENTQALGQWECVCFVLSRKQSLTLSLFLLSPSWCHHRGQPEQLKPDQHRPSRWFLPDRRHRGHHHPGPRGAFPAGTVHYLQTQAEEEGVQHAGGDLHPCHEGHQCRLYHRG